MHGASRPTFDVDCLPRRSAQNLRRLAAAMRELNARLHVEGLDDAESVLLPVQLDEDMLARMEISTWRTDAGDLDVLADIPDRHGRHLCFEELASRARTRPSKASLCVSPPSQTSSLPKSGPGDPRTTRPYPSFTSLKSA